MWKYVLDHKYLIKRGLRWILGDGEKIRFLTWEIDRGITSYRLYPHKLRSQIRDTTKISDFIENIWNIVKLNNILPKYVVEIINILLPVSDIHDKIPMITKGIILSSCQVAYFSQLGDC